MGAQASDLEFGRNDAIPCYSARIEKPVLVAEDQGLVREGIKNILEEFFVIPRIDEARSPEDLLKLCKDNDYSVVIVGYNIYRKCFSVDEDVFTREKISKFLVTTSADDVVRLFDSSDACVLGYVSRSCEKNEFAFAIDSVVKGRCYVCPDNAKSLIDRCRGGFGACSAGAYDKLSVLSVREVEVAGLINSGMTSKEIAVMLSISPATVDRHRNNILKKLGIKRSYDLRSYFS